jgi:hypothetical protein
MNFSTCSQAISISNFAIKEMNLKTGFYDFRTLSVFSQLKKLGGDYLIRVIEAWASDLLTVLGPQE